MKLSVWLTMICACAFVARALRAEDPAEVEREFRRLQSRDDALSARIEQGTIDESMRRDELARIDAQYAKFLRENPRHSGAMTAYGVFLYEQGREEEAVEWWQKAITADSRATYAYNALANHYGHTGRLREAFRYYEKAIKLEPNDPVLRYNWAVTCSLFRTDARAVYGWDTQEIFRRSLEQFRKARDLAPDSLEYAKAYAETFYLMPQPDWQEAHAAWELCLKTARANEERQDVYANLARVCIHLNRVDEARTWLAKIDSASLQSLRHLLERKLSRTSSAAP